jgi:BirA family biotin operon repressor/biotin-[acetyl-CoA-carboxylase] ligase
LSGSGLSGALVHEGALWRDVRVVAETGSTNADLLALATAGAPEGTVLIAESQTAGKGRLGRSWSSPAGAGLTFSVLLRPGAVPAMLLGWLPLLTGVAVAAAVQQAAAVATSLKWPNDVLASGGKLAGILAEGSPPALVVGTGLNVCQQREGLPVPGATSVLIERGGEPDGPPGRLRERLLLAILAELAAWYQAWLAAPGGPGDPESCGLRAEYLSRCATVGRDVRVLLPGGSDLTGQCTGVDRLGRLVVRTRSGPVQVSAGDVVHVR